MVRVVGQEVVVDMVDEVDKVLEEFLQEVILNKKSCKLEFYMALLFSG